MGLIHSIKSSRTTSENILPNRTFNLSEESKETKLERADFLIQLLMFVTAEKER